MGFVRSQILVRAEADRALRDKQRPPARGRLQSIARFYLGTSLADLLDHVMCTTTAELLSPELNKPYPGPHRTIHTIDYVKTVLN
ncbi:hypothetical protein GGD61_005005 [Bradyrhizobium sp. SBR1B]|nr:hypothetical protein [Bradyrhizobium sp. SBR1B]